MAAVLNRAGLGTLLIDLLTPAEELDRAAVFDIGLLATRLEAVTDRPPPALPATGSSNTSPPPRYLPAPTRTGGG